MKVILLKKIENLGEVGDLVEVKPGYGRNFLLKTDSAVLPHDKRAQEIIAAKTKEKHQHEAKEEEIEKLLEKIENKKFTFSAKADKAGKLYGSVGADEIAEMTGIPKKFIKANYKTIGSYKLEINLGNKKTQIQIEIKKKK